MSFVTVGGHGGAMVLVWVIFICFGGYGWVNMTWHVEGAHWVLTWGVSLFWVLPASLSTLLAHIDTLTSHLDGEEGVGWPSWGGMHYVSTITITVIRCSVVPKN